MKNPCKKTCPDRSATCHGSCERYEAWCEVVKQRRKENQRKVELDGYFVDISNRKKRWFNNKKQK